MVGPKITINASIGVQQRGNRDHQPDRLYIAEPFLVIENCRIPRHGLPGYRPQIYEPDRLDSLGFHFVNASDAIWLCLELVGKRLQPLCPVPLVGFKLSSFFLFEFAEFELNLWTGVSRYGFFQMLLLRFQYLQHCLCFCFPPLFELVLGILNAFASSYLKVWQQVTNVCWSCRLQPPSDNVGNLTFLCLQERVIEKR